MKRLLLQLARLGDIDWLSYHFASFIGSQAQADIDSELCLSAAMLCQANYQGSVCIDLAHLAGKPMFTSATIDFASIPTAPDSKRWNQLLIASGLTGIPGDQTPMTLDDNLLYLNRFWYYEDFIASTLGSLIGRDPTHREAQTGAQIEAQIETLFASGDSIDPGQQNAIRTAASKAFSVVSGGPGSGKTSTVVRILALLLKLDPTCRIALAAPTGKAAARMTDSIRERVDQIDVSTEIQQAMSIEARTIHRLLAFRRNRFTYDRLHRLPVDCVVVDEASMIDLKLMFHLLSALPDHCRLILLGDRDQLASVAAGNILGDITGHGAPPQVGRSVSIGAVITLLNHNYRFNRDTDIGQLADLVNQGNHTEAIDLLQLKQRGLAWYQGGQDQVHDEVMDWLYKAYLPIFECSTPAEALQVYNRTRALCVTNHGPLGVTTLNRQVSGALLAMRQLPETELFSGLPVMITRNHHELSLFNGDTGILWQFGDDLRACFVDSSGEVRDLALNRLPSFTPAWSTTVHKAQGSEFDSVLLIMPSDPGSEILSRELVYTAITRARQQFILHAQADVLVQSIRRITRRHSGLARKLGWAGQPG